MPPDHPVRSFVRLWLLCQVLFWLAWLAAWLWLPEGALRGAGGAAHLPLEQLAFWPRLFGIVGANTVASLIVAALGLLRWGPVSAGYVPVVGYWVHYALLLGSNSFAVAMPERLAPSLLTALSRAGIYELTAYALVAAATTGIARWHQLGLLGGKVRRLQPQPLRAVNWLMIFVAFGLIALGAAVETVQWCAAAGGCK